MKKLKSLKPKSLLYLSEAIHSTFMRISTKKIIRTVFYKLLKNKLALLYCNNDECKNNWGDAINPYLMKEISGKSIIHSSEIYKLNHIPVYTAIGSILDNISMPTTHIWGSGFLFSNSKIFVKPKKVYAVRGPQTRQKLISAGISCPEVYGDPALLFPKFYNPDIKPEFKLGIIPHIFDKHEPWLKLINEKSNVKIINIESGIFEFVKELKQCKHIASSSLHGLIAADAYNIPSVWIKISNNINGDGIKYIDYYQSQLSDISNPLAVNNKTKIQQILNHMHLPLHNVDIQKLIKVCPFKSKEFKI